MAKRQSLMSGIFEGLTPQRANFVIEYCTDFDARRAAKVTGYDPDYGYKLRNDPDIHDAVVRVTQRRLEIGDINREWFLMEAVENSQIAKQRGEISASNTALALVGKHVFVDAFAADKVQVESTAQIMERLKRGRDRLQDKPADESGDVEEISFL